MKICVISGIFHPEIGGPATNLYYLCGELANRGHKIAVIAYGDRAEKHEYPFLVRRIPRNSPIIWRLLKFIFQIIKIGKNYDLFYVDHYGLPVALANLLLHKPAVIRITGDFAWEFAYRRNLTRQSIDKFQRRKQPFLIELIKAVQCFYIKRADRIIVPSEYLRSLVKGWGIPSDRIDVVYNAVREEDFQISISQAEAKRQIGITDRIILTVARLVPWKGIDLLIKILPRFNNGVKLLVIGDGPALPKLKELACTLGVEERVIFKGEIPHHKLNLYLKAADIFVLPSAYEGLPHTILEAMISGTPIVATNVGGIPEIIQDGKEGLLVEPGNLPELKTAILMLLEDEKLKISIVKGAQEKANLFSLDKMTNKILELCHNIWIKKN